MRRVALLHRLLAATLMVAVFCAYGIGSLLTIKIEHHHHADGEHWHFGHEHFDVHHDDGTHHQPQDAPEGDEDGNEDNPADSHSHSVAMGVDGPVALAGSFSSTLRQESRNALDVPSGEECPDGPSFDLLKPPQLG